MRSGVSKAGSASELLENFNINKGYLRTPLPKACLEWCSQIYVLLKLFGCFSCSKSHTLLFSNILGSPILKHVMGDVLDDQ